MNDPLATLKSYGGKDKRLPEILGHLLDSWIYTIPGMEQDGVKMMENMIFGASCSVFTIEGETDLYHGLNEAQKVLGLVGVEKFREILGS